ncbi:serine/threonine-protein kinase [Sorangium sp. So ce887]|uniref:serine/threonine-protein kinase n=1 Tax=Sorangium sp. So ce887 TaxID=3133324 RepID=UPI003F5EEBA7
MSATFVEGTVFARRYRVVRLIATGSMGAVYEVVHLGTERCRALKVMHEHLFAQADMRERFLREARIAANVQSDHIVDVFDADIDEATGMPFLVMELLRGESLDDRLERLGGRPPGEAMIYLHQIALALDQTHAAAIVHRDLKPENLFITQRQDGTPCVKILDFGIAKLVVEGSKAAGATRTLGTPLYMAPEQFRSRARLTGAADVYALGMMAYTLLVGSPYWSSEASSAEDVIAFALIASRGPEEPPVQRARAQGAVLPPGFDAWFARATAIDPAARFPTAAEAVRALGAVLGVDASAGMPAASSLPAESSIPERAAPREGSPLRFAGTSTGATVSPMPSRRQSRGALVAALALIAVAALGVGTWLALRPRGEGAPAQAGAPAVVAASLDEAGAPPPPSAASSPAVLEPAVQPAPPVVDASASVAPPAPASANAISTAPGKRPPAPPSSPRRLFGRD